MTLAVLLAFGAPAVTFLSLAALPEGRGVRIGLPVAALVLAGAAVALPAGAGPARLLALLFAGAVGLAAAVQAVRAILPRGRPAWAYPALVALVLAAGLTALMDGLVG